MTMTTNLAIDVFLGLISVFLLYSLLASIIMETVAKILGLRARMTLRAISKLLEDSDQVEGNPFTRLSSTLTKGRYWSNFNNRQLTALFYAHPNIKNLGQNDLFRKPSTITQEMFAETFIQILRGENLITNIPPTDLISKNLNLIEGDREKQGILNVPDWYSMSSYQPLGKNSKIIICPLTLYQIKQFLFDSHSDIDVFKEKLMKWYNEMMDRATGWYTKQTRLILFIIGLFIALSFNVDAIYISKKLSTDKTLRDKMIQVGVQLQKTSTDNKDSTITESHNAILRNFRTLEEAENIIGRAPFEDFKAINILGWIVTGFAISLGAPFWFDLLSKIMSIRQAGNKPNDKSGTQSSSSTNDAIG